MRDKNSKKEKSAYLGTHFWFFVVLLFALVGLFFFYPDFWSAKISYTPLVKESPIKGNVDKINVDPPTAPAILPLDKALYDKKMEELANNPRDPIVYKTIKTVSKDPKTGKSITKTTKVPLDPQPIRTHLWPVKTVYPDGGAILPFKRIIAYYGNLYSKNMGVLGQYSEDQMLQMLEKEVAEWNSADPNTPAIPALHYIAVVAQGSPGDDGKYRIRMPSTEIDKVIKMAQKINALVFLDVQVGFSNVQAEIPLLEKYLKLPQVHLGIDPEFSMKSGIRPGKVVGTYDASDINFVANYLAKVVRENNLPPKILIVHRYTQKMVTNYQNIKPLPEVEIVMNMDGWGGKAKKIGTYKNFIYPEPVQFTGFKLFYKNDVLEKGTTLFTPGELLKLNPRPIYIQYQ